jgi:2'-5' RNA ligase
MKRARKTAVIYWLIPARAERELFASIIRILAEELDAPLFEPHLTLFSSAQDLASAKKRMSEVKARPFSLSIREVQFSAAFTETLFVRFRSSATLNHLVDSMQRRAGLPSKKISDPHLSLCYKKLPARSKRELVSAMKLPLRKVWFDGVKAVACPMPTQTADDVKAWRVITRKKLSK